MNESKKSLIIIILAVAIFAFIIFAVQQKIHGKSIFNFGKTEKNTEQENKIPEIVTPETAGAGKVGETEETLRGEDRVVLPAEQNGPAQVLPPAIFNDSGEVEKVKEDSLIIMSSGYSFADQKPRQLTLKYTEATRTNNADRTKFWTGFEGLKNFKAGDKITFESPENIRGKTEFDVSYVNQYQ
ncbi:MAG: hypothetical protein PHF44_03790 [Candidatus Pacebacteria bacterium]|nr:hypothetical protein [Candidatus Paceibacterota bacterium]